MLKEIYIVHYTKLSDRKHALDKNFLQLKERDKVSFNYIIAYDKEDLTQKDIDFYYQNSTNYWEFKVDGLWDLNDHGHRLLTNGEISCSIKHLEALKYISESSSDYAMVIEDDVIFDDNFLVETNNFIKSLPKNWDAAFIGEGCGDWFLRYKMSNAKKVFNEYFQPNHPASNTTECYIIKKSLAEKIYKSSIPFHLSSDWELGYQLYAHQANVYWKYIPIIKQDAYLSSLDVGQRK